MGTARLVIETSSKLAPLVSEALFAAGAQGIEELPGRGTRLVAYAETQLELTDLWERASELLRPHIGASKLPLARVEVDLKERWKTAWFAHLKPVELTPRFVLAPLGQHAETTGAKHVIRYAPALAFGDGGHATTRLAARALERFCREHPGCRVLDIGTGSGVLSIVAALSGARGAVGTDIDPEALRAAKENAALNGVGRATRFQLSDARLVGPFEVVVVNIELRPLLSVLESFPRAARSAERLLLTGFLSSQVEAVRGAAQRLGFRGVSRSSEEDWALLRLERA